MSKKGYCNGNERPRGPIAGVCVPRTRCAKQRRRRAANARARKQHYAGWQSGAMAIRGAPPWRERSPL